MKVPAVSRRTLFLVMLLAVVAAAIAAATLRGRQYACVSFEPGLRGEVMRGPEGAVLYFNGQCWTREPVSPTDTPM